MLLVSLVYVLRFSLRKLLKVCPFDKKTSVQLSQTSVHRRYLQRNQHRWVLIFETLNFLLIDDIWVLGGVLDYGNIVEP